MTVFYSSPVSVTIRPTVTGFVVYDDCRDMSFFETKYFSDESKARKCALSRVSFYNERRNGKVEFVAQKDRLSF